ncbi:MAG: hypothetical protein WA990_03395 [Rubrobacteraceae bacterium]
MNYLNSKRLFVFLSLAVAALVIAGYAGVGKQEPEAESAETQDRPIRIEVSYGFDVKDEEKLVGFSENVFTGRVIEQVGNEEMADPGSEDSGIPQTQFSVEPLEDIKGETKDTVTVNQQGGSIKQDGDKKKVLIEGDPLLEPGKKYMFVTRYEENKDWYTIAAQPFGDVKVEDKEKLRKTKEKFEKAKKDQEDPSKEFSQE